MPRHLHDQTRDEHHVAPLVSRYHREHPDITLQTRTLLVAQQATRSDTRAFPAVRAGVLLRPVTA